MSDKEGMQEEFMTMTSFILSYIAPSTSEAVCALLPNSSADSKSVAYLAQHQLFEQIPDLMDDIVFSDLRSKTEIIQMNTWIGTLDFTTKKRPPNCMLSKRALHPMPDREI